MRDLLALEPGVVPPPGVLRRLSEAWGNEGYAARLEYLEEVARQAALTEGPILECGTGLTTLVSAAIAVRRGVTLRSLEHDIAWAARVKGRLSASRLRQDTVIVAPLVAYDGYSWYQPAESELPSQFRLVICDGPPGDTPGGRYGLLPTMKSRLAPGALILLDDVMRESEQTVLQKWMAEGCSPADVRTADSRTYAMVTCAGGRGDS